MKTILFTFILFLLPMITFACTYIFQTPEESFADNPIVFIAEITNIEHKGGLNGSTEVAFNILKNYKGAEETSVIMKTGANSALCGFDEGTLKEGQVWVIHTTTIDNFNSLPANKSFETFEEAEKYMNSISSEPIICTLEYAPVCGKVDTGKRCVTEPCDTFVNKTYSNNCMLLAADAEFLYEGECDFQIQEPETQNPVAEKPENNKNDINTEKDVEKIPHTQKEENKQSFWQKIINFFKKIFGF